jgi:membrane protein YdbS with pleckstrin-like domain
MWIFILAIIMACSLIFVTDPKNGLLLGAIVIMTSAIIVLNIIELIINIFKYRRGR